MHRNAWLDGKQNSPTAVPDPVKPRTPCHGCQCPIFDSEASGNVNCEQNVCHSWASEGERETESEQISKQAGRQASKQSKQTEKRRESIVEARASWLERQS